MISHAAGQVTERCDFVIRPGSELLLCRARDLEDPRGIAKENQNRRKARRVWYTVDTVQTWAKE